MAVQSYQELEVWKVAMDLATECYRVTKAFPKDELFGMTSQIRRSAASIPANIAEGQGREHTKEFLSYVSIARGSLVEKRGVQAAGNGPSEDRKCWQGVELCIHGLRSWGCNLSRKVRATRSSSLCSAHLARITHCKFLQPLR